MTSAELANAMAHSPACLVCALWFTLYGMIALAGLIIFVRLIVGAALFSVELLSRVPTLIEACGKLGKKYGIAIK